MTRLFSWGQKTRRKRLTHAPWPPAWNDILVKTAHAWVLTAKQLNQWRRLIRILVAEKNWEGCDGFTMTDEAKVTIASQAALMLLAMPHDYFQNVRSVIVFPSEFELPQQDWQKRPATVLGLATEEAARWPGTGCWGRAVRFQPEETWSFMSLRITWISKMDIGTGVRNSAPKANALSGTRQ